MGGYQALSGAVSQTFVGAANVDLGIADQCLHDAGFGVRLDELPHGLSTALYKDFDENGIAVSGGEAVMMCW